MSCDWMDYNLTQDLYQYGVLAYDWVLLWSVLYDLIVAAVLYHVLTEARHSLYGTDHVMKLP